MMKPTIGLLAIAMASSSFGAEASNPDIIDRQALVTRHNITITSFDETANRGEWTPIQIGNGNFAIGVDATGLQTFMLQGNMGHATLSDWAWYTAPNPENYRAEESFIPITGGDGKQRPYAINGKHHWSELSPEEVKRAEGVWNYFRENPGRLSLGQIRFEIKTRNGQRIKGGDLKNLRQTLDLWTGVVTSSYEIEGAPVEVITLCHPQQDAVAVKVKSPLIGEGRLRVLFELPPPRGAASDTLKVENPTPDRSNLLRDIDGTRYAVSISHPSAVLTQSPWKPGQPHRFALEPKRGAEEFAFVSQFSPEVPASVPTFAETLAASEKSWPEFWKSGAAIDLSESNDPRWRELERRIVLGQYLTKVNSTGNSPPQESGLFSNSWNGKFHLEMTAWHGIHFALWGRPEQVEGWMDWYTGPGLEAAKAEAKRQGYKGARWMKMIAPSAEWESPSNHGPFRMTQNGHAIYWAEQMYRAKPTRETLEKFQDLVMETATFMADYLWFDEKTDRYVLGPPLLTGSEATDPLKSFNSTVELSYWFYGLRIAQQWRERLGLPRDAHWDEILAKLSKPPVAEGLVRDVENSALPTNLRPTPVGKFLARPAWFEAYGCMRGDEIDKEAMVTTFEKIWSENKEGCQWMFWGCDFPMMAMTAARLGKPDLAIEALLTEHKNNVVLASGFNNAGSTPYLPGTGGILWAVAMMAAGWEGAPDRHAPGFPDDGSWKVKWEGLQKAQ